VFLVGSWRGFPVQALPLQVPESPERSERLEVFFDSRRLTRGGGSGRGGRGCHLRGTPPPRTWPLGVVLETKLL